MKPWYQSKTIIAGIIIVLATIAAQAAGWTFVSKEVAQVIVSLEAVLFVILRLVTNQPVDLTKKDGGE